MSWVEVENEELRAGDVVDVLGRKTLTEILPYTGPLTDIIFAIANTEPGCGFSLERKGWTKVWRVE